MFLESPSQKFFKHTKITKKYLVEKSKKRGTKIFFKSINPNRKKDIFFSKLRKKINRMKSSLEKEGFNVYDYGFTENFVYFEMKVWKTSGIKKHRGPFVWGQKAHFEKFKKKWKNVYVEENRLVADVPTVSDVKVLIKKLIMEHKI